MRRTGKSVIRSHTPSLLRAHFRDHYSLITARWLVDWFVDGAECARLMRFVFNLFSRFLRDVLFLFGLAAFVSWFFFLFGGRVLCFCASARGRSLFGTDVVLKQMRCFARKFVFPFAGTEGTFISRHSPSLHFCCRDFNPGTFLSPFYFYFFPIFIHTFSILSMQRDQILT